MEAISYLSILKICMIAGLLFSTIFWSRLILIGSIILTDYDSNENSFNSLLYDISCFVGFVCDVIFICVLFLWIIGHLSQNIGWFEVILSVVGLFSRIASLFYHIGYKTAE